MDESFRATARLVKSGIFEDNHVELFKLGVDFMLFCGTLGPLVMKHETQNVLEKYFESMHGAIVWSA